MSATGEVELKIPRVTVEIIKRTYKKVFGRDATIHFDEKCADNIDIDGMIALTYNEVEKECETLAGTETQKDKYWFVEAILGIPQTRWEPEDVDYIHMGDFPRLEDALACAYGIICQQSVAAEFESIFYENEMGD